MISTEQPSKALHAPRWTAGAGIADYLVLHSLQTLPYVPYMMETAEQGVPATTEAQKERAVSGSGAESPGLFQRFKETVGLGPTKGEPAAALKTGVGQAGLTRALRRRPH